MEMVAMDDHIISNYSTDDIASQVNYLDENEQMKLIEKVMEELPPDDHLLITLFYKAENSIEDISNITGLTQSNV